jgi:hypothetical protein
MNKDALHAMGGTWQSFFHGVYIRRTRVIVDRLTEESQFPHLAGVSAAQDIAQAAASGALGSDCWQSEGPSRAQTKPDGEKG